MAGGRDVGKGMEKVLVDTGVADKWLIWGPFMWSMMFDNCLVEFGMVDVCFSHVYR